MSKQGLRQFDVNMEPVNSVFGSDCLQGDKETDEPGEPSPTNGVMMTGLLPAIPAFCGGAGDHAGDDMDSAHDFAANDTNQPSEQLQAQSTLDYVMQNFQCRLGNPRNRCYANVPFRLWAWSGSFVAGPQMWRKTATAVQATLQADDTVQLTELSTLRPLWFKFDDTIQDDAAHFLTEMVDLAQPANVIMHHFHVDHRQTVYKRKEFPTPDP